ncbi:MAG: hypothetical protein NUV75_14390 [Gallionella sp.]|nr:hypothetical protein [Gallionella sp.]
MIREATVDDIPKLLAMGKTFAAKARLEDHVGYDPDSMAATFETMIKRDEFALFIGEHGAIGGMRAPHPFNYARELVDEVFWWSEGREGIRLLAELEVWAGDAVMRVSALEAVEPERVGRLLARRGYGPLERAFVKVN